MDQIFNEFKGKIEKLDFSELNLYNKNADGRLNSAISEDMVFDFIKKYIPEIEKAPPRYWYDCIYKRYPFNIKITTGTGADNISSKIGMLYAMTGYTPEEIRDMGYGNINIWNNFNQALKDLSTINPRDYGFIVIFKKESIIKNVFITSLKRIDKLVSNGANLPFQANWSQNMVYTTRSPQEQLNYLKEIYIDSWFKKASGIKPLLDWRDIIV